MKINFFKTIFLIVLVLLTSASVFADASVHVNHDASAANNFVCSYEGEQDGLFKWTANGVFQPQFDGQFEIDSSYLTRGEVWKCEVQKLEINPITYQFKVKVIGSETSTIVNSAPVIISTPVRIATTGIVYTYDINAVDADEDAITYSLITNPSGMIINATTGIITWTPSNPGDYNVIVGASDGMDTGRQSFTITVSGGSLNSPYITTNHCPDGRVGQAYTCDIDASGSGVTYSLVSAPPNMTINSNTGVVSWTPKNDGTFDFTIRASNAAGSAQRTFTVKIEKNEADEHDLFVDSITIEDDEVVQGALLRAFVTLSNEGTKDFNDLVITMEIQELGLKSSVSKFDLDDGQKKTKELTLQLPANVNIGEYDVQFTIKNDDVNVVKYRTVFVYEDKNPSSTVKPTQSAKNEKINVVSQPTLSGYVPPARSSRLNWNGIVFMGLLLIALVVLSGYIIKRMRDQKALEVPVFDESFY